MPSPAEMQTRLRALHHEALRVGDSPIAADRLAARVSQLASEVDRLEGTEELRGRLRAPLTDAERVLRRDDDGREAARHLHTALALLDDRPRRPSPFEDD
jgi:hypothetical protein